MLNCKRHIILIRVAVMTSLTEKKYSRFMFREDIEVECGGWLAGLKADYSSDVCDGSDSSAFSFLLYIIELTGILIISVLYMNPE